MRKLILFLLLSSLILLVLGCQPTTTSPSGSEPAVEMETAVPTQPEEPEPAEPTETKIETAVPEETVIPTKSLNMTVEPLPTVPLEEKPMPIPPSNAVESSAEAHPEAVGIAVQDLAKRLDIDESEIEVVSVKMVIWPDASNGCPHPDMMYKQVQQDGLLIQLEVDGTIYNYHSGGSRPPTLCESPAKSTKPNPGTENLVPPPGDMDT